MVQFTDSNKHAIPEPEVITAKQRDGKIIKQSVVMPLSNIDTLYIGDLNFANFNPETQCVFVTMSQNNRYYRFALFNKDDVAKLLDVVCGADTAGASFILNLPEIPGDIEGLIDTHTSFWLFERYCSSPQNNIENGRVLFIGNAVGRNNINLQFRIANMKFASQKSS